VEGEVVLDTVEAFDVTVDIKALGEKVKYFRLRLGLNIPELASKAHTDKTQLSMLEKGTKPDITLGTINKLAAALEIPASQLLSDSELRELKPESKSDILKGLERSLRKLGSKEFEYLGEVLPLPVRGFIRAGTMGVTEQEDGEVLIRARSEIEALTSNPDIVYAVRVVGESLSGDGIHSGDRLLVLPVQTFDIDGDIYIIRDPDTSEQVVRHLYHNNGDIRVEASNPDYKPLVLKRIEIVGRVISVEPAGWKPGKK
jgi:SOS-response transcriptional repressor LexA